VSNETNAAPSSSSSSQPQYSTTTTTTGDTLLRTEEALDNARTDEEINSVALAEAKRSIDVLRAQHNATLTELQQLRQLMNNPNRDNRQQLGESTPQLDELRRELTTKEQIVCQQKATLQTKEQTITQLEEERKKIKAQSKTRFQKIQELDKSLTTSRAYASALESQLNALQMSLTETDSSNDQQNLKISQLTGKINQLKLDLDNENSRYKILAEKHATAENDIAEFTRIMTETRENLKQEALRDTKLLAAEVELAKTATAETRRLHKEEMDHARVEFEKVQSEYRKKISSLEAHNVRLIELQRTAKAAYDEAPTSLNQQLAVQAQQIIEGLSKDYNELKLYSNTLKGNLTVSATEAAGVTFGSDGEGTTVASISDTSKALWQESNEIDQRLRRMDDALNNVEAVTAVAAAAPPSSRQDVNDSRPVIKQQEQQPLPSPRQQPPSNKRRISATLSPDNSTANDYINAKKQIVDLTEQPKMLQNIGASPAVATTSTTTIPPPPPPPPQTVTVDDKQQELEEAPTAPQNPERSLPLQQDYTIDEAKVVNNAPSIERLRQSKIVIKINELSKKEVRVIVANVLPIQSTKFYNSKIEDKRFFMHSPKRRVLYAACLLKYVDEQSEFDSLMREFDESCTALFMALAYTRYVDRESTYRYSVLKHSIDDDYNDRFTLNNHIYYSEPEYELSTESHSGPTNTRALLQQYDKHNVYVEPSDEALDLYDKLFGDRMSMSYNKNLFDELLGMAEEHEAELSAIRHYTFFDYRWHNFAAPIRALRFKFGLDPDNMHPMPVTMLYVILHFRVFRLFSALQFQVYDSGNQFTLNKIIHLYIVYKNSMTALDQRIYEKYFHSMFCNTRNDWDTLIANETKSLVFFSANTSIQPWLPYKSKLQAFVQGNREIKDNVNT